MYNTDCKGWISQEGWPHSEILDLPISTYCIDTSVLQENMTLLNS